MPSMFLSNICANIIAGVVVVVVEEGVVIEVDGEASPLVVVVEVVEAAVEAASGTVADEEVAVAGDAVLHEGEVEVEEEVPAAERKVSSMNAEYMN